MRILILIMLIGALYSAEFDVKDEDWSIAFHHDHVMVEGIRLEADKMVAGDIVRYDIIGTETSFTLILSDDPEILMWMIWQDEESVTIYQLI